jgi:hypothetical protein
VSTQLLKGILVKFGTHNDDDVTVLGYMSMTVAKNLSKYALTTVALNGVPNPP